MLWALPFFGLLLYFFFGRNWPTIIQRSPKTRALREVVARFNAAAGGARVEFMVTKWLDKKVPLWAAESYFEPLLAAGAHIWLYEKASSMARRSPSMTKPAPSARSTWTCAA